MIVRRASRSLITFWIRRIGRHRKSSFLTADLRHLNRFRNRNRSSRRFVLRRRKIVRRRPEIAVARHGACWLIPPRFPGCCGADCRRLVRGSTLSWTVKPRKTSQGLPRKRPSIRGRDDRRPENQGVTTPSTPESRIPLSDPVESDGRQDQQTKDHFLFVALDPGHVQSVLNDGDDQRADQGAEDSAGSA